VKLPFQNYIIPTEDITDLVTFFQYNGKISLHGTALGSPVSVDVIVAVVVVVAVIVVAGIVITKTSGNALLSSLVPPEDYDNQYNNVYDNRSI